MAVFSRHSRSSASSPSQANNHTDPMHPDYRTSSPTFLCLFTATSYTISLVFLILVIIGNINSKAVIRSTYFLTINLANIIPISVPNANLINSIARSIGLHDFYQVGLWNFCEGYINQDIMECSTPRTRYWFDPVSILLNELLRGATIALPAEVVSALRLVRIASHWMFACFLVGTSITFTCIFIAPLGFSPKPRWQHRGRRIFCREIPLLIWTFLALLFTGGATVIATVMFVIFRNTFRSAIQFNIEASLGKPMFAFMWIAVGFNLIGFLVQFGTCCGVCCCSGRKKALGKNKAIGGTASDSNGPVNGVSENSYDARNRNGQQKRRFAWKRGS